MSSIYTFWEFLRRRKFLVTFIFFAVVIGFVGEDCFWNRHLRKQEIAALRSEMRTYQNRYEQATTALHRIQSSTDEVVRIAREEYFMKYPDEDIYVVMDATMEDNENDNTDEEGR